MLDDPSVIEAICWQLADFFVLTHALGVALRREKVVNAVEQLLVAEEE